MHDLRLSIRGDWDKALIDRGIIASEKSMGFKSTIL